MFLVVPWAECCEILPCVALSGSVQSASVSSYRVLHVFLWHPLLSSSIIYFNVALLVSCLFVLLPPSSTLHFVLLHPPHSLLVTYLSIYSPLSVSVLAYTSLAPVITSTSTSTISHPTLEAE